MPVVYRAIISELLRSRSEIEPTHTVDEEFNHHLSFIYQPSDSVFAKKYCFHF